MKPNIEKISNKPDFAWRIESYHNCSIRFDWHYHVEYELVLHRNFNGKKFVGDYSGSFTHNDLALYGPHLPHTDIADSQEQAHPHINNSNDTYIIWFSQAWISSLITLLPELTKVQQMLDKSLLGLQYSAALAERVYLLLKDHGEFSPAMSVSRILEILVLLSESEKSLRLNSYHSAQVDVSTKSLLVVDKISQFIEKNYREDIKVADLCEHIHVSKSTVARVFERYFLCSFTQHLAEYRIGKACEYLINGQTSIATIADWVGFNNLSNFNRQFKAKKQMTPKAFRQLFAQHN